VPAGARSAAPAIGCGLPMPRVAPDDNAVRLRIRKQAQRDAAAIRRVHEAAFARPQEEALVEALAAHEAILLSLVAVLDASVVAHALFSPVEVRSDADVLVGAGLGPLAVLPQFQRLGIGSKLVNEGVRRLRARGCPFVVVLGHPEYYPRFGFVPAIRHGIECQWQVPDDAFMLLALDAPRLAQFHGVARYREEFSAVE